MTLRQANSVPAHQRHPDWYRIHYQLAALSVNRLVVRDATIPGKDATTVETVREQAVEVTTSLARVTVTAISRLGNADPTLTEFLRSTIEPSALILLAAALLVTQTDWRAATHDLPVGPQRWREGDTRRPRNIEGGPAGRVDLDYLLFGPEAPDPWMLIAFVERESELAPRALYNLACFYTRAERLGEAKIWLERAVRQTPLPERRALFNLIDSDPTLAPLRDSPDGLGEVASLRPRVVDAEG